MPVDGNAETVRRSKREDIPALQALFLEAFGHERPAEIWEWKYFDNPRGHAGFVCQAGDRIVAHCAGLPARFRDFERSFTAYASVDFMSSPTYAGGVGGGGVFVRTVRRFYGDCCGAGGAPLLYGFPGERHRILGERLLGYRPVEVVNDLRLEPKGGGGEIRPLGAGDLRVFTRVPLSMGVERDEMYLRWRYLDHPINRYGVVIVRGFFGRARIGAVVREGDDGVVYLMEVGGSFSRSNVSRLVQALGSLGRPVVGWGSPRNPVGRLLVEEGFEAVPRDHRLEVRLFYERPTPREGEMYYTLGDYDVH